MANHPSAQKRNRQRITRTDRNRAMRSRVRSALKKARSAIQSMAITSGEANAAELVREAQGLLDSAATKNVVPRGRAARLKSRLALALTGALKRLAP